MYAVIRTCETAKENIESMLVEVKDIPALIKSTNMDICFYTNGKRGDVLLFDTKEEAEKNL